MSWGDQATPGSLMVSVEGKLSRGRGTSYCTAFHFPRMVLMSITMIVELTGRSTRASSRRRRPELRTVLGRCIANIYAVLGQRTTLESNVIVEDETSQNFFPRCLDPWSQGCNVPGVHSSRHYERCSWFCRVSSDHVKHVRINRRARRSSYSICAARWWLFTMRNFDRVG